MFKKNGLHAVSVVQAPEHQSTEGNSKRIPAGGSWGKDHCTSFLIPIPSSHSVYNLKNYTTGILILGWVMFAVFLVILPQSRKMKLK